jgi:hypothetical protein
MFNLKLGSLSIVAVGALAMLALGCGGDVGSGEAAPAVGQQTSALTTNQVQLLRARDMSGGLVGQGITSQNLVFDIAVQNLAFTKQVFVHLKDPCGGTTWTDVPASFVETASGNYELWRAGTSVYSFGGRGPFTFAIKYVVNGTTYWDNNGGANYTLTNTTTNNPIGVFGNVLANDTNVLLAKATANGTSFFGDIDLLHLGSSQKTVTVRYTTDNWAHQTDLPASYVAGPNSSNVESWHFSTNVSSSSVVFAISYTTLGVTRWDNNFTHNYTATSSGANGAGTTVPDTTQPFPPPNFSCNPS